MADATDEQLINAFRGGDASACEVLLLRYKSKVLSAARSFFLDGADTEDMVQEGMCALYAAIVSYDGTAPFPAYAQICIRNRLLDVVKKIENHTDTEKIFSTFSEESMGGISPPLSPEEIFFGGEDGKELSANIRSSLSPLEYRSLQMYIYGLTMTEITQKLAITYKQADNALVRAKAKIKELLNKRT